MGFWGSGSRATAVGGWGLLEGSGSGDVRISVRTRGEDVANLEPGVTVKGYGGLGLEQNMYDFCFEPSQYDLVARPDEHHSRQVLCRRVGLGSGVGS